ncbi:hypothetical protein ABPG74_011897 [Tetrahymena malaccensis]
MNKYILLLSIFYSLAYCYDNCGGGYYCPTNYYCCKSNTKCCRESPTNVWLIVLFIGLGILAAVIVVTISIKVRNRRREQQRLQLLLLQQQQQDYLESSQQPPIQGVPVQPINQNQYPGKPNQIQVYYQPPPQINNYPPQSYQPINQQGQQ